MFQLTSDKELLVSLGLRVRKYREAMNVSQSELSKVSGLHRSYIASIEKGDRNISYINLVKLAGGLNIKVSLLVED
ncbi:helix-turn-helix transcriptional regulator [Vibrio cholerae]|uniref:helix-turn-helix domain-containing protein n=1 Tax=Vibrio TaxID=662 RepID=UPI00102889C3|nr:MULTISPECIES: helix-turn-helix transcriptional regulator [Vibrio]EGR4362830.1 XRE family transcriptional regulator [Vibrio cholerae]EID0062852.1 helix-turn-helix transcriptional regulator [Vibrio vulnificus]EID0719076.1 helix-turn-helix transcriptional regulator [Vibrio vulnificus]EID0743180.1 helix-turn-helix transcriptional regulator [Vibrio vulnificus]EJL7820097.1 helix-turn-helix transcriptional regulator [Vibrio vulnificus]